MNDSKFSITRFEIDLLNKEKKINIERFSHVGRWEWNQIESISVGFHFIFKLNLMTFGIDINRQSDVHSIYVNLFFVNFEIFITRYDDWDH